MEILSIKQPWLANQPKESAELVMEEIRAIGGGGVGRGGSGNVSKGAMGVNTVRTVDQGSHFDLIIHHVASYPYSLQKAIFEALWGHRLNHGGMYVMEGLETNHQEEDHQHAQSGVGILRDIVAWAGSLLFNGRIAGG